jgi:hypothetical protein
MVRAQVLNGEQLWTLIEGLEANDLLVRTHLLIFVWFDGKLTDGNLA